MTSLLGQAHERLLERYGRQEGRPAWPPLESMVASVLRPDSSWAKATAALENLREAGLLEAQNLRDAPVDELAELIQPAGHARTKASRLRNLMGFLIERYGGSPEAMFAAGLETLRDELLAINGIGPETADSILLYAGNQPKFVVDLHAHRVLKRHGWIEFEADYHAVQEHVESSLPREAALLSELRWLFGRVGREHCRNIPLCSGCPLADMLPAGGPCEFDS
ncbi:MAG: endonuclease III domain-containing protein [Pirellulales bacterium]